MGDNLTSTAPQPTTTTITTSTSASVDVSSNNVDMTKSDSPVVDVTKQANNNNDQQLVVLVEPAPVEGLGEESEKSAAKLAAAKATADQIGAIKELG